MLLASSPPALLQPASAHDFIIAPSTLLAADGLLSKVVGEQYEQIEQKRAEEMAVTNPEAAARAKAVKDRQAAFAAKKAEEVAALKAAAEADQAKKAAEAAARREAYATRDATKAAAEKAKAEAEEEKRAKQAAKQAALKPDLEKCLASPACKAKLDAAIEKKKDNAASLPFSVPSFSVKKAMN